MKNIKKAGFIEVIVKYRESGMPDENLWNTFFDPVKILNLMEIDREPNILLDIGCGYGTFLFPASKIVKKVIGIDIDKKMIEFCENQAMNNGYKNIELITGDISQDKTIEILKPYINKIDYITLFNILHCEEPIKLLKAVFDILKVGGKIGVIHWKYEKTPRGPSMEIRPKQENIILWAKSVGFELMKQIDLPPYHYGIIFNKI